MILYFHKRHASNLMDYAFSGEGQLTEFNIVANVIELL